MQEGGDVSLEELKAPTDSAPSTTSCVLWSCAVDGVVYASNPDAPDGNSIAMNKRWGVPQVTCMAWLGGMAALGTPEGAVVVVKRQGLTAWTRVHTFYDHTKAVTAVAWCATSSQLATASNDATICVYALDGGVVSPLRHCLTGHGGGITCLDWSPSGVYLASASVDSTIQVWKVGRSEGYNFREHSGRVLAVTWVDDATLASGGDDQSIRKWTFADLPHTMPPKPKHIAEGAVMTAGPKRSVACTSTKKNKAAGLASLAPPSSTTMFHTSSPSNKLAIEIIPTSGHALTDFLRSERAQFEAEGDVEAAGRLLLLQGRIGEALRLVSRHEKLSPVWLAHAPMAGLDVWREYTRLYADRCRDRRNYGDAVEAFLSIGEVYAAIECLVKGSMWKEALTVIHLRCAPSDPILQETTLLYIAHLKAQEMWRDAGTLLQSLSMTDQAISCFLKQHDTLGVALELMDPTCTSVLTLVDIGTRGILNRQFEVVERVVHLLSAHKAQAFLLQVFVFYTQDQLSSDTPPTRWMLDDTSTLWSHLHDKANVVTLPLYLQTMLDQVAPKSDKVWARLIPYVQSLVGDVDDIEDAFAGGVIDTAFVKLMEANTVGYMVVKCLCQMSLDLVQGNFLAAFEAWSACLAQVAPLTSSNKGALLEVCALVFPTGVNSTPPPVGELVTDSACSRELWATFFLYQSVAFSRSLRAAADADDDNDHRRQEVQGALLFVIQWINQLLPAHVLQDMDESVVRVAQTALNDLSLLYHQLLDDNRPPLAEISAPST